MSKSRKSIVTINHRQTNNNICISPFNTEHLLCERLHPNYALAQWNMIYNQTTKIINLQNVQTKYFMQVLITKKVVALNDENRDLCAWKKSCQWKLHSYHKSHMKQILLESVKYPNFYLTIDKFHNNMIVKPLHVKIEELEMRNTSSIMLAVVQKKSEKEREMNSLSFLKSIEIENEIKLDFIFNLNSAPDKHRILNISKRWKLKFVEYGKEYQCSIAKELYSNIISIMHLSSGLNIQALRMNECDCNCKLTNDDFNAQWMICCSVSGINDGNIVELQNVHTHKYLRMLNKHNSNLMFVDVNGVNNNQFSQWRICFSTFKRIRLQSIKYSKYFLGRNSENGKLIACEDMVEKTGSIHANDNSIFLMEYINDDDMLSIIMEVKEENDGTIEESVDERKELKVIEAEVAKEMIELKLLKEENVIENEKREKEMKAREMEIDKKEDYLRKIVESQKLFIFQESSEIAQLKEQLKQEKDNENNLQQNIEEQKNENMKTQNKLNEKTQQTNEKLIIENELSEKLKLMEKKVFDSKKGSAITEKMEDEGENESERLKKISDKQTNENVTKEKELKERIEKLGKNEKVLEMHLNSNKKMEVEEQQENKQLRKHLNLDGKEIEKLKKELEIMMKKNKNDHHHHHQHKHHHHKHHHHKHHQQKAVSNMQL